VPRYGTHTVAEHTFALILGLSRKLVASIERTKRGGFDHHELTGFDLYDKTIGIVGLGDIGKSVMKIAKGFGMHVVAYSRHPDESLARRFGVSFLDLNELFAVADIVTLHVPYVKQNHHMINKRNIKKFKKGSLLINTARGPLVETEAVVYGLEKGILQGFGSDVLEGEDIIKEERQILSENFLKTADIKALYLNHVLMGRDNVVVTPHNAFNSIEALRLILDVTVENIHKFTDNQPQNTV
jgi:D-lactate dehydrogenase